MNANEFGKADSGSDFSFGLYAGEAAAALRKLADRIELGECQVYRVSVTSEADVDDFAGTTLKIKFAEKVK